MKKNSGTFYNVYCKYAPYFISFLIALIAGPLIYCSSYFVHELGHKIFGLFSSFLETGTSANISFTNWINCTFFRVPQQTTIITERVPMSFVLGGIILNVAFFSIISYYYYKNAKNKYKKAIFLVPIIFIISEFFGNFLCGTDNPFGKPFNLCQHLPIMDYLVKPMPYLLTIPIFILLIPPFQTLINKIMQKNKSKIPKHN